MNIVTVLLFSLFIIPVGLGIVLLKRSRKLAIGLISIPFVFMFVVGGWLTYEMNHRFISSTALGNENIGEVELHQELNDELKDKYGAYDEEDHDVYHAYLHFDKLEIGVNEKNEMIYVTTDEGSMRTNEQISVGDSLGKVKDTYGDHYYESGETEDEKSLNYIDRENDVVLKFWYKEDKITKIILSDA